MFFFGKYKIKKMECNLLNFECKWTIDFEREQKIYIVA